jgi:alpha-tubulin suppressor-like RCC1 family protein
MMKLAPLAGAVLTGCSTIVGDSSDEPSRLEPTWTNTVTIGAGQRVEPSPGVTLVDQKGRPISGHLVEFSIAAGEGALEGASVRTDAKGKAVLGQWRVGGKLGAATVQAWSDGVPPVSFNVNVTAGPLALLKVIFGDNQTDTIRAELLYTVDVKATDAYGNYIGGVPLTFVPDSGSGVVTPISTVTSEWGIVSFRWKVGPEAGTHRVRIRTGEATQPVEGVATAQVLWPSIVWPRTVGLGREHSCAKDHLDEIWCWGSNEFGQVGDGSGADQPVAISLSKQIFDDASAYTVHLGVGDYHGCAAKGSALYCWGRNDHGQLGDGTRSDHPKPTRVALGRFIRGVQAGQNTSCAHTADGLYCWGHWRTGEDWLLPRLVTGPLVGLHVAVVADGAVCIASESAKTVNCYDGRSFPGGVNLGAADLWKPVLPRAGYIWRLYSAGDHFCAEVNSSGYCWGGQNKVGQLGSGTNVAPPTPETLYPIPGSSDSGWLVFGPSVTCRWGIRVSCWGANNFGILRHGFAIGATYLVPTDGGFSDFNLATFGESHACAELFVDAPLYPAYGCWGNGARGQLGNGLTQARDGFISSTKPVVVGHR